MIKRILCAVIGLLLSLIVFFGCASIERQTATGFYFDTVITITAYARDGSALKSAIEQCKRYEAMLSRTVEGSDVWNINHSGGKPVSIQPETMKILLFAQDMSALTEGAFDITVAPAAELWDFSSSTGKLPDAEALKKAAALTDYTLLRLDEENSTAAIPEGHRIDLGGIAKGYIADRLAEHLAKAGIKSAVVNLGGNVMLLGGKPDGSKWQVGIQDPASARGEYLCAIARNGGSVVTSGIYERGFTLNGVRYHHILQPETGWPVQNELAGVTVCCESSMKADALSTACFILGTEKGMELVKEQNAEAVFITRSGEIIATERAKDLLSFAE